MVAAESTRRPSPGDIGLLTDARKPKAPYREKRTVDGPGVSTSGHISLTATLLPEYHVKEPAETYLHIFGSPSSSSPRSDFEYTLPPLPPPPPFVFVPDLEPRQRDPGWPHAIIPLRMSGASQTSGERGVAGFPTSTACFHPAVAPTQWAYQTQSNSCMPTFRAYRPGLARKGHAVIQGLGDWRVCWHVGALEGHFQKKVEITPQKYPPKKSYHLLPPPRPPALIMASRLTPPYCGEASQRWSWRGW